MARTPIFRSRLVSYSPGLHYSAPSKEGLRVNRLSPRQRLAIVAAPLTAAASLTLEHFVPDASDAVQGLVMGVGIGVTLVALMVSKRQCSR